MRRRRRLALGVGMLVLGAVLALGSYALWYITRTPPAPITQQVLFEGVRYDRVIHNDPRPLVAHVVTVDLGTPGVQVVTTPPGDLDGYVYTARTVREFAAEFGLQVAINGDFFDPWYAYSPWNYYPHTGDGVNVRGAAIYDGQALTDGYTPPDRHHTLYIYDEAVTFTPDGPPRHAISGNLMAVVDGEAQSYDYDDYFFDPHPRTAVGLSADGETLLLFVVDGRQPNYSEGATIEELAALALEYDAHNVLNLDGGGSATLVAEVDGRLRVLNTPIHGRLPGGERPVANHIGIALR